MPDTLQSFDELDTDVDTIAADYMAVRTSSSARMELKLLPLTADNQLTADTLLCVVRTYLSTDGESDIRFYTRDWQRREGTFGLPLTIDSDSLINCLTLRPDTMTAGRYYELCRYFDPIMFTARLSADNNNIVLTLSTPMLNRDEETQVKTIIRPREFKWDGTTFN